MLHFETSLLNITLLDNIALCKIEDDINVLMVQFSWKIIESSLRYDRNGGEDVIGGHWI